MKPPVLRDKNKFPTDAIIFSHIGKAKPLWISFFADLHTEHPELSQEWRYYNDGKSWLMKVTRKSKTIFWLGVLEGTFRITSYFTDKAHGAIAASALSATLKRQFLEGQKYGRIRGITVTFKGPRSVKDARKLVELKC